MITGRRLIPGIGGGMIYIASFVCVSAYFLSKRPLATSISSCGSSAGIFVFGFLYRVCIDHYGWRGALLVFSGFMMNGVICGALFRPFLDKPFTDSDKSSADSDENSTDLDNHATDFELTSAFGSFDTDQMFCDTRIDQIEVQHLTDEAGNSTSRSSNGSLNQRLASLLHSTGTVYLQQSESSYDKINNGREEKPDNKANCDIFECSSLEHTGLAAEKEPLVANHREITLGSTIDMVDSSIESPDDMYTVTLLKTDLQITNKSKEEDVAVKQDMRDERKKRAKIVSVVTAILGTSNLHLFKDRNFVLYGLSAFLYSFGDGIPFILLPDMAEMNGKQI